MKDGILGSGGPHGGSSCAWGCRVPTSAQERAWGGICDSVALGGSSAGYMKDLISGRRKPLWSEPPLPRPSGTRSTHVA